LLILVDLVTEQLFGLEIGVHLNHALCKLDSRKSAFLIYLHLIDKALVDEVPYPADALVHMVEGERLKVEIDTMGKIKISGTSIEHESDELFVSKVLLQHHIGHDLGNVVLQIVPILTSLQDWIDSFVGEKIIYLRRVTTVLVQLV
jgi:hypothetical protein